MFGWFKRKKRTLVLFWIHKTISGPWVYGGNSKIRILLPRTYYRLIDAQHDRLEPECFGGWDVVATPCGWAVQEKDSRTLYWLRWEDAIPMDQHVAFLDFVHSFPADHWESKIAYKTVEKW